jgi:hypothetical protein
MWIVLASAAVVTLIAIPVVRQLQANGTGDDPHTDPRFAKAAGFSLPGAPLDAGLILGHKRADVDKVLGTPVDSDNESENFQGPVKIHVHYAGEVADVLVLGFPSIGRHERYARRWVHLAGDGPMVLGSMRVRVDTFQGDDDRIGFDVLQLPPPNAPPKPHRAAPPRPPPEPISPLPTSADELVRAFPELPDALAKRCEAGAKSAELHCTGFDGAVSYELDSELKPRSLTVLDPTAPRTEADCRELLTRFHPDLLETRSVVEPGGKRKHYFTGSQLQGLYVWWPVGGFRTDPSCAAMVCRKGSSSSCELGE